MSLFMGKIYSKLNHNKMEKKDATFELPLADGSVIPKIQQKTMMFRIDLTGGKERWNIPPCLSQWKKNMKRKRKEKRRGRRKEKRGNRRRNSI